MTYGEKISDVTCMSSGVARGKVSDIVDIDRCESTDAYRRLQCLK